MLKKRTINLNIAPAFIFSSALILSALPQLSMAGEASRKAYDKQIGKQWEWNKDESKDEYKNTKSYWLMDKEQKKVFDEYWSKKRQQGRTMQW